MIRYLAYLPLFFAALAVAIVVNPFAVLFAEKRLGGINNDESRALQPKLPVWLSWLDTPDNSLWGDDAHKERHPNYTSWWAMTCWLYRNPIVGFRWNVLGAPVVDNRDIFKWSDNYYEMGGYFQFRIGNLTFGWILDAYYERNNPEPKAIYYFWR